ncbi:Serine/threonine-protein phosphatase [Psidium guajava]|nr:Serine/threonine-protein phosphatase [Psidium guajava]
MLYMCFERDILVFCYTLFLAQSDPFGVLFTIDTSKKMHTSKWMVFESVVENIWVELGAQIITTGR